MSSFVLFTSVDFSFLLNFSVYFIVRVKHYGSWGCILWDLKNRGPEGVTDLQWLLVIWSWLLSCILLRLQGQQMIITPGWRYALTSGEWWLCFITQKTLSCLWHHTGNLLKQFSTATESLVRTYNLLFALAFSFTGNLHSVLVMLKVLRLQLSGRGFVFSTNVFLQVEHCSLRPVSLMVNRSLPIFLLVSCVKMW